MEQSTRNEPRHREQVGLHDGNGTLVKKAVVGGQTTVYVGPHYEKNVTTGQDTKYCYFCQ